MPAREPDVDAGHCKLFTHAYLRSVGINGGTQ